MNLKKWIRGETGDKTPEYLALPLELEDGRPARFNRAMLKICAAAVFAAGLWASATPIRELALAPGQIMPEGDVRSVQHLEGGIVASITAKAGDHVNIGDPILVLGDQQAARDLKQYKVRAESLNLQKQQLGALLAQTDLELRPSVGSDENLVSAQQGVFSTRLKARLEEARTMKARIEQRLAEVAGAQNEIDGFKRLVAIQTEKVNSLEGLMKQGLTTRREFLADKAALEQAKSQQVSGEARLATLQEQLKEAKSQAESAEADARRLWSEEMAKIQSELAETEEAIAKLTDRFDRLTVRSPADGIVQFVAPRSPGEVIKPGDTVARIVPMNAPLQAEVEVRADDIGHVKVGDPAEVKVSTYDPSVYGKLRGHVAAISASTFQRQNGEYFFKATIALDQTALNGSTPISAGMVVSAEIVTGAKSLARYLLKPVFKTMGTAFAEK